MKSIAIVMAVYSPNIDWLREQLISLNNQTYTNLCLYIRDDHSPIEIYREISQLVPKYITNFQYYLERNDKNIGSNATFSLLTEEAIADYIAYCDQDDIWEVTKLLQLLNILERENAALACCDLSIIDEYGNQIAKSICEIKPHIRYFSGYNLVDKLLSFNFVTGCAMLMPMELAKSALPMLHNWVYDQWLGIFAASKGYIVSIPDRLVKHRMHSCNQTHTLSNIKTKDDYIHKRIYAYYDKIAELNQRINLDEINKAEAWAIARCNLANGEKKAWRALYSLRNTNKKISYFELILPIMPKFLFRFALNLIQKGKI